MMKMKRASRSVDVSKLAQIARADTDSSYPAGHVPGGGAWGSDGRQGAFRRQLEQIKSATPGAQNEIAQAKGRVFH